MPDPELFNEHRLLLLIADGDEKAFSTLYYFYYPRVLSISLKYLKSSEQAEDMVQDIFTKIWLQNEKLTGVRHFRAYLYTMLRNQLFNALRKIANEHAVIRELGEHTVSDYSLADQLYQKQLLEKLQRAVRQLAPQQKRVFELGKLEGLKHDEIAQILKISPETVKKHMMDAVRAIKTQLHPRDSLAIFLLIAALK